ncbi:Fc.00g023570.m01.CDS01 [Cosmosporella sp. VM-42]
MSLDALDDQLDNSLQTPDRPQPQATSQGYVTASSLLHLHHTFMKHFLPSVGQSPPSPSILKWQSQQDDTSNTAIMNPEAVAFTPTGSTRGASFGSDSSKTGASQKVTRRSRLWKAEKVESTSKPPQPSQTAALDPERYDLMFPALSELAAGQATTPVDPTPNDEGRPQDIPALRLATSYQRKVKANLSRLCEVPTETTKVDVPKARDAGTYILAQNSAQGFTHLNPAVNKQPPKKSIREEVLVHKPASSRSISSPAVQFEGSRQQPDTALSVSPPQPLIPNIMVSPPPGLVAPYCYLPPLLPYPPYFVGIHPPFVQPGSMWPNPLTQHEQQMKSQSQQSKFDVQPHESWHRQARRTPRSSSRARGTSSNRREPIILKGIRSSARSRLLYTDPTWGPNPENHLDFPPHDLSIEFRSRDESMQEQLRAKSFSPGERMAGYSRIQTPTAQDEAQESHFIEAPDQNEAGELDTSFDPDGYGELIPNHQVQVQKGQGLDTTPGRQCIRHTQRSCHGSQYSEEAESGVVGFTLPDGRFLHSEHRHEESPLPVGGCPPANAPTGPACLRRVTNNPGVQIQQKTLVLGPTESGAWSQSKRWMSLETKERAAFQKMMANLHYMAADKSPFVPQNPAELTAFKADVAESQQRKLAKEVKRRLAKPQKKNGTDSNDKTIQLPIELLGGRQL